MANDDIIKAVNEAERALPVPQRVLKNIGLAFALEPIPEKKGCTTRYHDLKPTLTLEMLTAAAVNSSLAYMHLAEYCLEQNTIKRSYKYLLEAMTYSKWARGGGKVNQGMLEFTVPIVATQMLEDPQAEKDPFRILEIASYRLKDTTRDDVEYLIRTKTLGNVLSDVQHKYQVREHPEVINVFDYYAAELALEEKEGYGTGIVHNRQFVDGFSDVRLMLDVFVNSQKTGFSDRAADAFEAMLSEQHFRKLGTGVVADLIAAMLYMAFSYSKGDQIVK